MQQHNAKTGMRTIASALLLASPLGAIAPAAVKDRNLFCIPHGDTWTVQDYAPLVDTRNSSRFIQAIYEQRLVTHMLVKTYTSRYELVYDYKFTDEGKLIALKGSLRRWGHWIAQANLFPDADGTIPTPQVDYRMSQNGGIISTPEDGRDYVGVFSTVPVYRTTAEMPCAVLLKEAEKKNATQE